MRADLATLTSAAAPARGPTLLLKAIAGDDAAALVAWREWRSRGKVEAADGTEFRLLAAVGRRLLDLPIDPGDQAALSAIKHQVWRQNRLRLHGSLWILRRLADARIPVMLLKGGARLATEPGAMETRVVRDLDLLFPSTRLLDALDLLLASGLRSVSGRLPGMVKSQAFAPAGPRRADYMEVDIHAVPLRLGQTGDYDEGLWRRAEPAELLGVPILVPAIADRYLHALAHGLVADDDRPADWAVDAMIALRDARFDPAIAAAEIRLRRVGVPVWLGSAFLRDDLGVAVPAIIFDASARDLANPIFRREMAASLLVNRERSVAKRVFVGLAERYRSRTRPRPPKSWNTAWIFRPSWRRPRGPGVIFADGSAVMTLPTGAKTREGRLVVYLDWPARTDANHAFDIFLDGVWIARLRIRALTLLARLPRRSWRASFSYRLPHDCVGPGPAMLTARALDERKRPSAAPLPDFRIFIEIGS